MPRQNLANLIDEAEQILTSFYAVNLLYRANDFLIKDLSALDICAEDKTKSALTLFEIMDDEIFLGIYFEENLAARIDAMTDSFDVKCLSDIACVFEEISHFHHLLHATQYSYSLSHMELEYMAELEKIILLTEFMHKKFGHDFSETIVNISFTYETFLPTDDQARYVEASKKAHEKIQHFFSQATRQGITPSIRQFRDEFREEYYKKMNQQRHFERTRRSA